MANQDINSIIYSNQEIWKKIEGFPWYEVSNYGRVRSYLKSCGTGKSYISKSYKILKPGILSSGHLMMRLSNNAIITNKLVHRLVLETYIGHCPDGLICCHNDGNPKNNHISNLRWDTPSSNMYDSVIHGTKKIGEAHHRAKITQADVLEIRRLHFEENVPSRKLAKIYDLSKTNILDICKGNSWKHIGGQTGSKGGHFGESVVISKLTDDTVREARNLYNTGNFTYKQLANMYGVDYKAIYMAINKQTWKHVR